MNTLPYFLLLLQKNALLCSIITTHSFAQLTLTGVPHELYSQTALSLIDFYLNEQEKFSSVRVMIVESGTTLTFHTDNADYFDHPEKYFQTDGVASRPRPYLLNGASIKVSRKYLGDFVVFPPPTPPVSVYVRHSSLYGYVVSLGFYEHNKLDLPLEQHLDKPATRDTMP